MSPSDVAHAQHSPKPTTAALSYDKNLETVKRAASASVFAPNPDLTTLTASYTSACNTFALIPEAPAYRFESARVTGSPYAARLPEVTETRLYLVR